MSELEKLIKELELEFNEKIDEYNVGEYCIMKENRENCSNCSGLFECKNSNLGYYLAKSKKGFVQKPCKYLNEKMNVEYKNNIQSEFDLDILNVDDYDLDTINRQKVFKEINKFVDEYGIEFKRGLYIYGNFSVGKTYTLAYLAKRLKEKNIKYLFIYFPDLVGELKMSLGTNEYYDKIDLLKNVDVLILDDFGAENITSWLRDEVIGPVINHRIIYKKSLFISSNIAPGSLKEHFMINNTESEKTLCGRIVSRLNDLTISVSLDANKKYRRF